jgi:DNA-directed RNA polymerase specialized sigma24 family protein
MSPQASWILQEEICPRLGSAIPKSVLCVGSEDHQELVQDGITMAAKMIDRVDKQGKLGKVSASNIAYYTIQHLKSGRRANGSSYVDIMASATQLNGSAKLHSFSEVVSQSECGDEIYELHDVISSNYDDPAVQAARNIDWAAFTTSLTKLEVLLIQCLINGLGLGEAAKIAKVHYSTMLNYRNRIAQKLIEYMGTDILKDIAVLPTWRIGLDCERELLACRADRRN